MEGNGYDGRWMVVVSREMDGSWEWYNEMGQGNEWRGRVVWVWCVGVVWVWVWCVGVV